MPLPGKRIDRKFRQGDRIGMTLPDRIKQGEALFEDGHLKEAEKHFLEMMREEPNSADILNNLGTIRYAWGDFFKAEQYFLKVLQMDPEHSDASANLAYLHQSAPSLVNRNRSKKITMNKDQILEILKKICYSPHPESRKGTLTLSAEIFQDRGRETNVIISPGARIDLTGDIHMGPWTMIGAGTNILTHDHYHEGRDIPLLMVEESRGVKWLNKRIGRDVWLHGCTVLYQVTDIPDGVVVGNGSVLTKNPGPYEIWAGNPARKIGER